MIYYILFLLLVLFICNYCGFWIKDQQLEYSTAKYVYRETITTSGLILLILVLVLFEGLRDYSVGTDTPGYCRRFERGVEWDIGDGNLWESEPLFNVIIIVAHYFSPNYVSLLMIVSTICAVSAVKSIRDNSVNFTISVFSFITLAFYLFGFAAMRQGIALCVFMLSLKYVIERNIRKFLIVVFIGALVHKTLLITIPVYFLGDLKFTKKSFIIILTSALLLASSLPSLLEYTSTLDERYEYYTLETKESSGALLTLFAVFLFVFFFLYRSSINKKRRRIYDLYLYMLLISACIYIVVLLTGSNVEINRFAMYFQVVAVFSTAEFYNANSKRGTYFPTLLIIVSQLVYYLVYVSKIGGISKYMINSDLF